MTDEEWKKDFQDPKQVHPHCHKCSDGQGGSMSTQSQMLAERHAELVGNVEARADMFLERFGPEP
jgi:hypothetical protein